MEQHETLAHWLHVLAGADEYRMKTQLDAILWGDEQP